MAVVPRHLYFGSVLPVSYMIDQRKLTLCHLINRFENSDLQTFHT